MNTDCEFEMLNDREFIINNMQIGYQRCGANIEPMVKRPYEDAGADGFEEYLYVMIWDGIRPYSIKITEKHLNKLNISVDDAWKRAQEYMENF